MKRQVAETVPMLCQWECRNKVTPVTQKIYHGWQLFFEVWESCTSMRLNLVHKWAGPKSLIG